MMVKHTMNDFEIMEYIGYGDDLQQEFETLDQVCNHLNSRFKYRCESVYFIGSLVAYKLNKDFDTDLLDLDVNDVVKNFIKDNLEAIEIYYSVATRKNMEVIKT